MKVDTENEFPEEKQWPVRPYYKRELAEAYAPNLSPTSALNRLSHWFEQNRQLSEALEETGYKKRQQVFTSVQVGLIFRYLGRP